MRRVPLFILPACLAVVLAAQPSDTGPTPFNTGLKPRATTQGAVAWVPQSSPTKERLRAVSARSDKVAWASGNRGTVLRTVDSGVTWTLLSVPGAAELDFRDIEAFDAKTAYVLAIGAGDRSRIYRTTDGGRTWTLQFTNDDPKAFYDAIAFFDKQRGLAVGDPVDGRATVLRTTNGGRAWERLPPDRVPPALPGDGSFAASGTCLVTAGKTYAWFATGGGAKARVFHSADAGDTWTAADTKIAAGNPSSGIFSLAFLDAQDGVAVGGDYRQETAAGDNLQFTTDGGETWTFAGSTRLRAFRSAVAYVPRTHGKTLLAVGPTGTDRSDDHGRTWLPTGDDGYHALSIEPGGRVAWAVGEQGRIARLTVRR
jgi:photosystem II stability/assembly factor-like uncharacterized protein